MTSVAHICATLAFQSQRMKVAYEQLSLALRAAEQHFGLAITMGSARKKRVSPPFLPSFAPGVGAIANDVF
jgi:hypothetical protein